MKRGRILGWVAGGGMLAAAAALSTVEAKNSAEDADRRVKRVRVAEVEAATAPQLLRFAGVVRAAERAHLSFPVAGRLAARPVAVGDGVARGEVVARLDGRELANAVAVAAAGVEESAARRRRLAGDRERLEALLAAKAATHEEAERARRAEEAAAAAEKAATTRLREARRLESETVLRAPFAGTVSRTHAEPGERLAPGQPVVLLAGGGDLEVEVGVPEAVAAKLVVGAEAVVELPLAGRGASTGRIVRAGRAAEVDGLFPIVVGLEERESVLSGMTAEVVLAVGRVAEGAVAVPLAAVLDPGGQNPEIFLLEGDRVRRVAIEVLRLFGERVAVHGELTLGARVVVTGHTSLLDGDRVEVVP